MSVTRRGFLKLLGAAPIIAAVPGLIFADATPVIPTEKLFKISNTLRDLKRGVYCLSWYQRLPGKLFERHSQMFEVKVGDSYKITFNLAPHTRFGGVMVESVEAKGRGRIENFYPYSGCFDGTEQSTMSVHEDAHGITQGNMEFRGDEMRFDTRSGLYVGPEMGLTIKA